MVSKQYYLGCLAHASYMLADEQSATAVIVDPQRDVEQYIADAAHLGCTIRYVVLTHFHADFLAGHLELRDRCSAEILLGARARAEYPFRPMHDGDSLDLPGMRIQVLETPGHTIESISLTVFDLARDPVQPCAVLTGDTLFIGDVGRPDLRASLGWTAEELSSHLYHSLHEKLLKLPDETLVYPAHGAGSLCGKHLSSDIVSTLGQQRRFNYALQPMSLPVFTRLVAADQPDAPAYFDYDALLNTQERPTLDRAMQQGLRPLALPELLSLGESVQLLDTRDAQEYAAGHLSGSLNIGLSGQYATWAGTLLDRSMPIVIIAAPGREQEAMLRLGRIGFDHVVGYLAEGMAALSTRDDLLSASQRIDSAELHEQLASGRPMTVVDVRSPAEWQGEHIEGSLNLPLSQLPARLLELPRHRHLVIHCAGGYRSSAAVSLLARHGLMDVAELAGGIAAWQSAGLPLVPAGSAQKAGLSADSMP